MPRPPSDSSSLERSSPGAPPLPRLPGDLRPTGVGAEPVDHLDHHQRAPHHDDPRAVPDGDRRAPALARGTLRQDLRRPQPPARPARSAAPPHTSSTSPPSRATASPSRAGCSSRGATARSRRSSSPTGMRTRRSTTTPARCRESATTSRGRATSPCWSTTGTTPVQQGPRRRRQPAARLRRRRHQRRQGPSAGPEGQARPDRPDGPLDGRRRDLHRAGRRAGPVQGRHRVRPGQLELASTTSRSGPGPTGPRPSASSPPWASPPPTPTAGPRPARARTSTGSPSR